MNYSISKNLLHQFIAEFSSAMIEEFHYTKVKFCPEYAKLAKGVHFWRNKRGLVVPFVWYFGQQYQPLAGHYSGDFLTVFPTQKDFSDALRYTTQCVKDRDWEALFDLIDDHLSNSPKPSYDAPYNMDLLRQVFKNHPFLACTMAISLYAWEEVDSPLAYVMAHVLLLAGV